MSNGFTAIELMVILLVVAILAAIAVPNYSEQIASAQIVQAIPLADIAKNAIAAQYTATQTFPVSNAQAAIPPANYIVSNLVSSVTVENGAVTMMFGNQANGRIKGKTLTMRPAVVTQYPQVPIAWICGNAAVPAQMTIVGTNKTNLTPAELPYACRG